MNEWNKSSIKREPKTQPYIFLKLTIDKGTHLSSLLTCNNVINIAMLLTLHGALRCIPLLNS